MDIFKIGHTAKLISMVLSFDEDRKTGILVISYKLLITSSYFPLRYVVSS